VPPAEAGFLIGAVNLKVRLVREPAGTLIVASSTRLRVLDSAFPMGGTPIARGVLMDVLDPRCAALDVHKDKVMAAVRTPGRGRARRQVVREFRTFTNDLVALRDWLIGEAVTQVAMEATGVYWKPVWHVLEEAASFEL
jgi:hypothetical protein